MWDIFKLKKAGIFAGGVLFGTAGVKILASDDAKKVYTNCTAAVLRAKECVLKTAATIQENAKEWYDGYHFGNADIYCPWDVINFARKAP